ncbi:hypothetical protein [Streptomyces sp. NPDC004065]|uniref:hypothetical protein n=1 Tax=Streptomyces sp. NPDC004065 TaxID=3364689 RepID=UPI00384F4DC4
MEQRTGTSSQPLKGEPVTGAGFDPAFIPGLTAPATPAPKDASAGEESPEDAAPEDAVPEDAAPEDAAPEDASAADTAQEETEPEDTAAGEDTEAGEAPAGPVFEAADRRARIVADHKGVRLVLDDQQCEFRWEEIGAVETATPRFGKRFTVTVHTPDRRWYPIEIEASSRSRFAEWEKELDAVLDAYFEEDAEQPAQDAEQPEREA